MKLTRLLLVLVCFAGCQPSDPAVAAGGSTVKYSFSQNGAGTRMLLVVPGGISYKILRTGDVETVRFGQSVHLSGSSAGKGPSVRGLMRSSTSLSVGLVPKCDVRVSRSGTRLELALGPSSVAIAMPQTGYTGNIPPFRRPDEQPTNLGSVLPGLPAPLVAVVDSPAGGAVRPEQQLPKQEPAAAGDRGRLPEAYNHDDSGQAVTANALGPVSIAAAVTSGPGGRDRSVLVPFDRGVGAAAYRKGGWLFVVFDSEKPVDLSAAVSDPLYRHASYSILRSGAVLSVPAATDRTVAVQRQQDGWRVTVGDPGPKPQAILPDVTDDAVKFGVTEASHVVVVPDATSGTDMLVGTTRRDGQALLAAHRGVDYVLSATILGVAVERLSESLELRPASGGFVLSVPPGRGSRSLARLRPEQDYSRILDLANVDVAELQQRYTGAVAAAAAEPPAARRAARLDAAEAALGLGRGREAEQIAAIADQDAPGEPDEARSRFLHAAGSALTGAPDASADLGDPKLGNSDEVALWRALDEAGRDPKDAEAAHVIAERLPLLQSYPERLRQQLLGEAALSMAVAGTEADADVVLGLNGGGEVALAKGLVYERRRESAAALVAFDRAAADPEPGLAVRAVEEAVSLRLKKHLLTVPQAAEELEAHVLDARMAGDELSIRLRIADLRAEQHDWAAALVALREINRDYPESGDQVRRRVGAVLQALAAADPASVDTASKAAAAPIRTSGSVAQLALLEENLDLLPPGEERSAVTLALASRLEALDLVDQAAAVVRSELDRSEAGLERGRLGFELARLQLDENDHAAASLTLDTTDAATLPEELVSARTLLRARIASTAGDAVTALRVLQPLQGPEAEELRARELESTHDWGGEEAALAKLVSLSLPQTGPLDGSGEDLVLRLGGAEARAGDKAALRQLEPLWKERFQDGAKLAMLQLLASPGVKTLSDLPGSKNDLAVARAALPAMGADTVKHGS